MSDERTTDFLYDIREATHRIITYTDTMTFDIFLQDLKTQDAVVRNLEIIGEATKQIPDEIRQLAPHIPWTSIAGMRDKLIHRSPRTGKPSTWQSGRDRSLFCERQRGKAQCYQ